MRFVVVLREQYEPKRVCRHVEERGAHRAMKKRLSFGLENQTTLYMASWWMHAEKWSISWYYVRLKSYCKETIDSLLSKLSKRWGSTSHLQHGLWPSDTCMLPITAAKHSKCYHWCMRVLLELKFDLVSHTMRLRWSRTASTFLPIFGYRRTVITSIWLFAWSVIWNHVVSIVQVMVGELQWFYDWNFRTLLWRSNCFKPHFYASARLCTKHRTLIAVN